MDRKWNALRYFGLAAGLTMGVVAWEYLLNALMNPEVNWNVVGVGAHMALDLVMILPLLSLALACGLALARRLGMERNESAGLLGTVGVVALVFMMAMLPLTSTRDLAHEYVGNTYGLSLAEVQTTVVRSDLTVQEKTQLCSFGSVRNPSLARGSYQDFEQTVLARAAAGFQDALIQQAAFLPLLFLGFFALYRRESEWSAAPIVALARTRTVRLGTIGLVGAFALFCVGYGFDTSDVSVAHASLDVPMKNACEEGGPVREYDVSAIDVTITLNRFGDHVNGAYMYALDANIDEIRQFQQDLEDDRVESEVAGDPDAVARVSFGLRKDLIQPLVIRANMGECLRINFTNALSDGQPASMHILGLPHTTTGAASFVGNNANSMADPDDTIIYEIPIPDDPQAERSYYFHDHGAGRRRQNMGLFGGIVVEPKGATYLDVETGEPLDNETGSNWEAIIIDPNLDNRTDGKSFREFVIFYHEIGDEGFTDIRDANDKKLPLVDDVAGVYRPAARALNYRSEPFRRRIELEKTGKALGYASYPFGDPSTPVPRSYVGEGVKTRLMHGSSEVFHVHHLHGGGDRWRRNPDADPNNDFWKGLTKVPDPNLTSIHLDSQSIGPGTSYNLEHECGAGGCQQGVGEFLFHCHIGHHYISGMWSFWRVFGTVQTEDTNVNGFPLAVVPELFQADNPFSDDEAPSNTPPADGVSAGDLIGLTVDDNRTIVADADVSNPDTQIGVLQWIKQLLPPAGVPLDKFDNTVWNWTSTGGGGDLQVWGEPEGDTWFGGYVTPLEVGERPEVLFNPKNGRYTWPLFRPHLGQRPPFTARHTGAPWLGEEMKPGRIDGLCAVNGVHPAVDVGTTSVKRFYPVSAITLPLQVTKTNVDPDGQIFVLNEDEEAIRDGRQAAEPLAIRSNVGDCVEILFTNKIPDGPLNKDFSKVNIHSHFVQFDTQASDGVITGFSYEQSVRPIESEGRWLVERARPGDTTIRVNHVERLHPELGAEGIWLGIGLGKGVCGENAQGEPTPCTEIRQIVGIDTAANTITLDRPLENAHRPNDAVGVEFVRYHWYSDVDFGTVFYHTHVEFKDWDHGLFGTHIVEPKGSTYHDPVTGDEVRAGTLVDIRVDPAAGGNPAAWNIDGSFREFMLFLQSNNPVEGRFVRGGGTINLRAEPWRLRDGDAAHRFSSVTHGDPHTQEVRAYVGDPVIVRGMGLVERVGGVRFSGHRFNMERYTEGSDARDTTYLGISERFDVSIEGGAGGPGGFPGDYLYYSTLGREFESGAWGVMRVYDGAQPDLQPLPENTPSAAGSFPSQGVTGGAPVEAAGPGDPCPAGAAERTYDVEIAGAAIVYNDQKLPDVRGVVYRLQGQESDQARTPLVMRANHGECLVLNVRNSRNKRSSVHVGELLFDPQGSYGAAIGFNEDSTIAPGASRSYRYYADEELGMVAMLNLGDIDSVEDGAYGAVVVEPEGATYFRPGRDEALPGGGTGIQADIMVDGVKTREYVALFSDQDRRIGQNAMPYPSQIERFNGISYTAEPLTERGRLTDPAEVFASSRWGDPRHVVTVPEGTPLTYRIGQMWGNQAHVPTLEGHRWLMEPGMPGSEQLYNDVLVPGMNLNFHFVGGAGSGLDLEDDVDYLFLDRRQPFLEGGLWNILRVTADGTSGADDLVAIRFAQDDEGTLVVSGRNGIRPAGDFATEVEIYANGDCTGTPIGTQAVNPGRGTWTFQAEAEADEVCVQSAGGGQATATVIQ